MRLKSVFISQYKNLRNFSLDFEGDSFLDVFVGKNGSGKSNLLEALVEIFRHLDESRTAVATFPFDYRIRYEIDGTETSIGWENDKLTVNGRARQTLRTTPLPDNVLIYYSGHNDTVSELVGRYETAFRRKIKGADLKESRRFIGIGTEYKALLLVALLLRPEENEARQFICRKLGIASVGEEMRLTLKRPQFASGRLKELKVDSIELFDPRTHYWGAQGITRQFLEQLAVCIRGEFHHSDVYDATKDRYELRIDTDLFQRNFSEQHACDIFRQFDNLKTLEMLSDITVLLRLNSGVDADIGFFSDGQFQAVYIYAVAELFKDRNCLTLLDEPDAFLHPEWQFEFLKQVFEISEAATKKNHVLMSSHSAATLCKLDEQQIRLLTIDGPTINCCKRSKKDVIRELSDSFIQYTEDEGRLLIDNVIRTSSKPVLFVEGPSDVRILSTAYQKLFPGEDTPVLIQDAFDRGFLKIMMSRNDIFRTYPQKCFFALFDFDDAYQDWRALGGEYCVKDIGLGLCRKLEGKNAYAFVLPIPENQLRAQVWDEENQFEKIRPNPHFCIELAFWDVPGLEEWFRTKKGVIKFRNDDDKVKFANEVVPRLDAESFKIFRPLFEFIKANCAMPRGENRGTGN
jgi:ABC-type Mn2+/Zn2+ transport system ATPase subunit